VWLKRLARGRFDWPEDIEGAAKVAISATEFAALMDGLELTQTRAKLWWRKKVGQAA
jgi:IS66 Orf2 like protein